MAFLFVNDGSTDRTPELLKQMCDANSSFSVHEIPTNQGKAEAVRQGVLEAFDSNPQYIGIWDADLSVPLDEIPRFCKILDRMPEKHMVFGARVKLLGRTIERSVLRHYFGRLAATLIAWTLDLQVYDAQCGAKLLRATQQIRSVFERRFISRWIFDVEIVARAIKLHREGLFPSPADAIYELPLNECRHAVGSKVKTTDYLNSLRELARIYREYL